MQPFTWFVRYDIIYEIGGLIMETLEERMFRKLTERINEFERSHVKVKLPDKRKRVIDLYRRCKLEFDDCRFGCKSDASFIQIKCVGRSMLDVKEAGSFLGLLRLCDYIKIEARPFLVIIDMRFSLTAWVEKPKDI